VKNKICINKIFAYLVFISLIFVGVIFIVKNNKFVLNSRAVDTNNSVKRCIQGGLTIFQPARVEQ